MHRWIQVPSAIVAIAFLATGCLRGPGSVQVESSSVFIEDLCPGLEYDVIGDVDERWTGMGFFGQPTNGTPNFAERIAKAVREKGGDAVIDLRVSSNLRLIYALYYAQVNPRFRVMGKIIKYRTKQCLPRGTG